ncbi:hypothetical protein [Pseudoalteromonas maricaloris]
MVEINRANQVVTQPQSNRAEQQTLAKDMQTQRTEGTNPTSKEKVSLSVDQGSRLNYQNVLMKKPPSALCNTWKI